MMNNIKFFLLVIGCLVFTNVLAQSTSREELEKRVEEVNKILPISVKQGIIYKKQYILGNSVYNVNEIDENYISLSLLAQSESTLKKGLLQKYFNDSNLISFAQIIIKYNMNIVVLYISKQSGKVLSIMLSSEELMKYLE